MGIEYWIGAIVGLFIFIGILLAILRAERRYWMRRAMKATQSETLRVMHRGPEARDAVPHLSYRAVCPLCGEQLEPETVMELPSGAVVHEACFSRMVAKNDPDGIPGVHDV